MLAGDESEVGADAGAGEPVPVAELDGEREAGQGRDPSQAAQPAGQVGELAVSGHRRDRSVEPVAAGEGELDRFEGGRVGGPGAGLVEGGVRWFV